MAYSKVEDVRAVLTGARGDAESLTPNVLDDDQIEFAISNADEQINAALRKRYVLPIAVEGVALTDVSVPPLLHNLSVDIAVYLTTLTYRSGREFQSTLDSSIQRYQRALSLLTGIGNGTVEVPVDELGSSGMEDGTVYNQYGGPLFPSAPIFNTSEGVIPPMWVWR
ncbi:MAG TPA: phage protein Gp36 family protein [Verrucomicrobiae bacterium]|nr:phage protein Gp36 family protein [Verrucomicrobiae bacterium]